MNRSCCQQCCHFNKSQRSIANLQLIVNCQPLPVQPINDLVDNLPQQAMCLPRMLPMCCKPVQWSNLPPQSKLDDTAKNWGHSRIQASSPGVLIERVRDDPGHQAAPLPVVHQSDSSNNGAPLCMSWRMHSGIWDNDVKAGQQIV